MTPPIRTWILEDHGIVRDLMVDFLSRRTDMKVVGASGSSTPFLTACLSGEVDLAILDLMLEDTGGLRVLETLNTLERPPKVIVFSAMLTLDTVQTALKLGASGYIEKAAPIEEMNAALDRVIGGGIYLSPCVSAIASRLVEQQARSQRPETLTARELSLLAKIARGMSAKELAREIGLSEPATYKIKRQICAKLNVKSDQELTLIALRMGVISPESIVLGSKPA
jgi:DNA-binding NarL/FixJ family response regulator